MNYKKLKQLREEYEITQARLGEFMRVKEEEIDAWESGIREPSIYQIQRLATLFNIDDTQFKDELEPIEKQNNASKKTKTKKGKTKKKSTIKRVRKSKRKIKKGRKKDTRKRSLLPIVLFFIILLLGVGSGAGYLYWKYGDDYYIGKKADLALKQTDLVGNFYIEQDTSNPTLLTLKSGETFILKLNNCEESSELQGTWSLKENMITLQASDGSTYTLQAKSSNELHYNATAIRCGPSNKDVFIRGNVTETPPLTDTSTIATGTWEDDSTTLLISTITNNKAVFTLTSKDINNPTNIAILSNIEGMIVDSTIQFSFVDDGFGSAGTGKITIVEDTADFSITKTVENKEALWNIPNAGLLKKK